jgi:hypothetical protein
MCTELLPPGGYPTAVNKYIISIEKKDLKAVFVIMTILKQIW